MRVKGLDETLAALRATGLELPDEPREARTMGGRQRFVLFRDPDGHLLELIELLPA
jgi:catechol 2,3-dioxygenase-like lactoylglutathione lyase family enzyme